MAKRDADLWDSTESRDFPPVVLVAGGIDPTGSAGLVADIRVLTLLGCHPLAVATCETVQSSEGVKGIHPSDAGVLREQLSVVISDLPPNAVKIGALASAETIEALGSALRGIPEVPVVLDPVFAPSEGPAFLDIEGMRAVSRELLPHVLIATPNLRELGAPAGIEIEEDSDEMILGCGAGWLGAGVQAVLVTGLRRGGEMVDRFITMDSDGAPKVTDIVHPVHDVGEVHGSGCVLASALAGYLAKGEKLLTAARKASDFTSTVISRARRIGKGAAFWVPAPVPGDMTEPRR